MECCFLELCKACNSQRNICADGSGSAFIAISREPWVAILRLATQSNTTSVAE
jgi:hypothetical protein